MAVCEKCWSDAYMRSRDTGKSQTECYYELLEERKDNPCPVQEDNEESDSQDPPATPQAS